jgi:hypothetical protein
MNLKLKKKGGGYRFPPPRIQPWKSGHPARTLDIITTTVSQLQYNGATNVAFLKLPVQHVPSSTENTEGGMCKGAGLY